MSKDKKGVLIFTHLRGEGACNLGRVLLDRNLRIQSVNTPTLNFEDVDPLRPDLLIVMGGPIGVYQKEHYPYLQKEIDVVKARLEADLPTIGVCLGSQIMVAALGEKVFPGEQGKELGWFPLEITEKGQKTEAAHLCSSRTNMFHWHGDTFDLPKSCDLLASSKAYKNQIFQHGKNALGLQCHPEVNAQQLEEWLVMFVDQITGEAPAIHIDELRVQSAQNISTLEKQSTAFFNEWLENRGL